MKSLLSFVLNCFLFSGILACFEEQPLRSDLQKYLAQKPSCADTLFPEPTCCGSSIDSTNRIVNGESTGLREQAWTVYIELVFTNATGDYPNSCGGSLINSQWVLTAAHCTVDPSFKISVKVVRLGEWDLVDDPDCIDDFCAPKVVKMAVAEVIPHPEYNQVMETAMANDLALLRLERPVAYTEFIRSVCLPLKSLKKQCFENQKATALGWGNTKSTGDQNKKLKTTLTIWETDKCDKYEIILQGPLSHKYQVCASAGANYTCHGDSGGPLTLKLPNTDSYYLVGVVSGGITSCDGTTNHPAIFSVINMNWIVDVILKRKV